jgi:hypothetical protein
MDLIHVYLLCIQLSELALRVQQALLVRLVHQVLLSFLPPYLPPLPTPAPSCEDLSSADGQESPAPKDPPEAGDCDAAGHGVVPAGLVLLKPSKFCPSDILLLL